MPSDTRIPKAEPTGLYDAMSQTPPTVTDELPAELLEPLAVASMA